MKLSFIILSFIILLSNICFGQDNKKHLVQYSIVNGDTLLEANLPTVWIISSHIFKSKKEERYWNKLMRNVKKVYPYAVLAQIKMKEYENTLTKISSESEKRKYMKNVEQKLKDQFEAQIKKMTFSQGKILVKLIDRQTGETTYSIIKEFRGSISAILWQSVGRIFGINIKTEYDPEGTDKEIEQIVQLIEMGVI